MITESFDRLSPAKINPGINPDAIPVDACIVTFSWQIETFVKENFPCEEIGKFWFATGGTPVYRFPYNGKQFAFYRTYVGAPACVASIEDTYALIQTDKYVLFGAAGCLNKEIARGKIMVPTAAYRDEGTSYHYVQASDYIQMPNAPVVAACMKENGIPYVLGKTWTTDAIFRETDNNFERRKAEGCISVEMEGAAVQALCDFRNLNLFAFFTSGDLLDSPKWDIRRTEGQLRGTQHDPAHFDIALTLADYITK